MHRHTESAFLRGGVRDFDVFEVMDEGRALVPRRLDRGGEGDVVALEPRNRDCGEAFDPDFRSESGVIGDNRIEGRLIVADQVHLVHRQHQMPDAEQVDEVGMAPCLLQHALARIDQDHGQIGGRSACHHVAGVLFMPRRIGDDELALLGREEAIGDIDGDALFALRSKAIDQQRKVDLVALRPMLCAVAFQRGQLVFEDHLRVVEQPPDQGRFAVIHAAAGDEAQQALVLMRVEIGVDILGDQGVGFKGRGVGHQKYPSCFLSSMLADCPLSMARP